MNDLFEEFSSERNENITPNQEKFIDLVAHYKKENKGFHEVLGETLVDFLFYNVLDSFEKNSDWYLCYESFVIKYFVLRILQTDTQSKDVPNLFILVISPNS